MFVTCGLLDVTWFHFLFWFALLLFFCWLVDIVDWDWLHSADHNFPYALWANLLIRIPYAYISFLFPHSKESDTSLRFATDWFRLVDALVDIQVLFCMWVEKEFVRWHLFYYFLLSTCFLCELYKNLFWLIFFKYYYLYLFCSV